MSKVRKQFILDDRKVHLAQKVLKASTATEAVDQALTFVISNSRIVAAHRRASGRISLKNMDQSCFDA